MNLLLILTLLIFTIAVYILFIRPWHLHWGASNEEVKMILPGDEKVSKPDFNATRGISINSTPDNIWKWIIQIGSKRAGWYSIDWMDNAGIPSSNKILPEFQSSSPPHQQTLTGRGSHTTVRTGLVYGGSLNCGEID